MVAKDSGPPRKYHVGDRFGRWTLLERLGYQGGTHSLWRVRCECGEERTVQASNVMNGQSRGCGSCGARKRKKR